MKKVALLLTMLVTFACTAVHAQFTQSQLVDEFTRAKAYTKAYLDAMPEDGYALKPTPIMRTFAQQMLHLADGGYFLTGIATGKPNPMGKGYSAEKTVAQTKEATTKAVMDSYDYVIATLKAMTPEQLQEKVKFDKYELTRFEFFGKAFEHQTHHRGQTTVYIRLKGLTPPDEQLF